MVEVATLERLCILMDKLIAGELAEIYTGLARRVCWEYVLPRVC